MQEDPTTLTGVTEGLKAAADEVIAELAPWETPVGPAVDFYYQLVLQITNCVMFALVVAMNSSSQYFMTYSLSQITAEWNTAIDPAGWAFSIWGVIYTLLGFFVAYQALPNEWVPFRNNDLIFNQITFVFAFNCLVNSAWLPIFQSNTTWGFIVGLVFIAAILASDLYMMVVAGRAPVNWIEVITVRAPFSVYSGWVTAATILNMSYMLKSWGMSDPATIAKPKNPKAFEFMTPLMFTTEEIFTCIILSVAELIYLVAAYSERNPLFGSVYLWVLSAILENTLSKKS
jgi:hypothetical protein